MAAAAAAAAAAATVAAAAATSGKGTNGKEPEAMRGGERGGLRRVGEALGRIVIHIISLPLLLPIFNFIPWDVMVGSY